MLKCGNVKSIVDNFIWKHLILRVHALVSQKKYLPFEAFDEEEKKKKKKVVGEQKTIGPIKEQSSRNSFVHRGQKILT